MDRTAIPSRFVVARVEDVPPGERLIVTVKGHSIGVFNVGGRYYALLNRCPHQGAELCRGKIVSWLESDAPGSYQLDVERKLISCPWHGWEFDLATGQSYFDPRKMRVKPYAVGVERGCALTEALEHGEAATLVEGPYRAESLSVEVEDDYLVVTLRRAA
jgi:nitrite reductase/ring-hydroxylating ferredoxin subunit